MRPVRLALAVSFVASACGDRRLVPIDDGDETIAESTTHSLETSASTSEVGSTVDDQTSSGAATNDSSFLSYPDSPNDSTRCDLWANDCPAGEKCIPWANDGGSSWNATKCSPLARDPKQPGEPCTVEGNGVSGIDDCDVASMCWDVDPETNTGTCAAYCTGTPVDPGCENPCETCVIAQERLSICLPICDPVARTCPDGYACYPINIEFGCLPDASGDLGAAGDPCEYINSCDSGLFCADPRPVPDCAGSQGCCAFFCDPVVNDPCPGAPPGVVCVPWLDEPSAVAGCIESTVGACVLP